MELYRKNFEVWKNDIYLLPTIRIFKDNMMYKERSISLEIHFIVFHARLLWLGGER